MNKMQFDDSFARLKSKQGFALVVALSLMSLIIMLVLSLSALMRVELQVNESKFDKQKAQQNALIGLKVAIGQLQELAGPDQRVTGVAELTGSAETEQNHWTGVWDASARNPYAPFAEPTLLGWLVSGRNSTGSELRPGDTIGDPVVIVAGGDADDAEGSVAVGRVEVASGQGESGHFAYWVSDEGVKAKVTLHDPHGGTSASGGKERRYSLMSAQRSGIESVSLQAQDETLGELINPVDEGIARGLSSMVSLDQFGVLDEGLSDIHKHRLHDLTTSSYGLLTNVASGGIKKDLSLAFEMRLSDFNAVGAFASDGEEVPVLPAHRVNYLFRFEDFAAPGPVIANPVARGPTWHLLRNYYRLYKQNDPDRMQSYKPGHPLGVQPYGSGYKITARPYFPIDYGLKGTGSVTEYGYRPESDPVVNDRYVAAGSQIRYGRETDMPITPVVLRMQNFISTYTRLVEGDATPGDPSDDVYRVELQIHPVITIWNPYNIALEFETLQVKLRSLKIDLKVILKTPAGVEEEISTTLAQLGSVDASEAVITMNLTSASGDPTVMSPGMIAVYSIQNITSGGNSASFQGDCYPYNNAIQLEQGFVFDKIGIDEVPVDEGGTKKQAVEVLAGAGTEIRFEVKSSSWMISDVIIVNNGKERAVNIGRMATSEYSRSIEWPGGGASDIRLVEEIDINNPPNKHPIGLFDLYLKPASDNNPVQFLTHYNPRATSSRRITGFGESATGIEPSHPANWELGLSTFETDSWDTDYLAIAADGSGYWGSANTASGYTKVVLYEVPTLPLQSLASFQHVNNVTHFAQQPGSPIGNSYASPYIAKDALSHTIREGARGFTQIDWSYLSNTALWDDYFFSTLSPRPDLELDDDDWSEIVSGFESGLVQLPNSRIQLLPSGAAGNFTATVLDDDSDNRILADAYERVGEMLAVDGAFNVNSTSFEAWKALLGSTNKVNVDYLNAAGTGTNASASTNPYGRLSLAAGTSSAEWSGFRELSDGEIHDLAVQIVEQVKLRGPFVSMADFVNRRLANDETGLKGALQAAIDATNINSAYSGTVSSGDLSSYGIIHPDHAVGPVEAGATGYLRQADLLQTLGQVMTVRSDTFLIRSYGDIINPHTGGTVRAWCEAVVQRVPAYLDNGNAPGDRGSELNEINDRFGRKFKVVSFRWLREDQI